MTPPSSDSFTTNTTSAPSADAQNYFIYTTQLFGLRAETMYGQTYWRSASTTMIGITVVTMTPEGNWPNTW